MKNEPKGESQMKSQLFEQDKMEKEGVAGSFLLQNRHTLKVELNGEVYMPSRVPWRRIRATSSSVSTVAVSAEC
jgi:hypothetical protein